MKRSEVLDGLRGVAVLLVLASHASNAGHHLVPGLDARGVGRPGVFLFFVLSSYLLTAQLLGALDDGRSVAWGRFALRRVLRVFPAYALVMGLHVVAGAFTAGVALQHLGMVRAEAHFWTVPVEVMVYLALPPLALLLHRVPGVGLPGAGLRVLALLALGAAARIAWPPDFPAKAPDYVPFVGPFLPIFLVGSAVAVLAPRLRGSARALRVLGVVGLAAVACEVALAPAVWESLSGQPVAHTRFHLWFDAHGALLGLVVLAAVVADRGWIARALAARWLGWIGRVSYSTYLAHGAAMALIEAHLTERLPGPLMGPVILVVSVAAGALGFFVIERPFLALVRSNQPVETPAH